MENDIPDYGLVRITLTAFYGAHIGDVLNEEGSYEKCVCIPVDRNGLTITSSGNVSAYGYIYKWRNANIGNWTHNIRMKLSRALYKKMKDLGFETPFIGNLKAANNYISYKLGKRKTSSKVKLEDLE